MVEYYFQDQLRWSFGFENPNKAAALIASLLPFVWLVAQVGWKTRRPALKCLLVSLGSIAVCIGWWLLFMTYSRGGIVAAAAGFLYIGWRLHSVLLARMNRARLVQAMITLLGVALLFAGTSAAERSTEWVAKREGSVENRFELWRGGFEMIAQIPQGVGRGKSGAIYMQWFQPLGSTTRYRTLVNSYLTFAAEQGLLVFGCVVLAATVLWTGTKSRTNGSYAVDVASRGSLIAFAMAGVFSTTMEEWKLWIVPGICVLALVAVSIRLKERQPWRRTLGVAAGAAVGICGLLYAGGWDASWGEPLRIAAHGEVIQVRPARTDPTCQYRVWGDEAVLGEDSGKLLRRLALERNAVVRTGGDAQDATEIIVVAGESVARLSSYDAGRNMVLIAPARMEEDTAMAVLHKAKSLTLFASSFDDDGRVAFWKDIAAKTAIKQVELEGVGTNVEWAWDQLLHFL